jgi:hypothetical protein
MSAAPIKLNYKIYQGSTFTQEYRWESSTKVYAPITNITKSAPVVITAPGHQIPLGWRARVTNVSGMKEINFTDTSTYVIVTDTTSDTITLNSINSLAYTAYTTGGVVEYNKPVDLALYSGRMQIRETLDSDVIYELNTSNGGVVLDNTLKTITINIPASVTQNFTFDTAVYSLELYTSSGKVVPMLTGNLTLIPEVTR